jgi:hypothetical protein
MTPFAKDLFVMLIRQALKLGGLAGLFTNSELEQAIGAVSLLVGLAWSGYNAWQKSHGASNAA